MPTFIHENGSMDIGGFKLENTDFKAPTTYKIKNIQIEQHPPVIKRTNRVQYIYGDQIQNILESFNDNTPIEISKSTFTKNNYDIKKWLSNSDIFTNNPFEIKVSDDLSKNSDGFGKIDIRKSLSNNIANHFTKIKISNIVIMRQRGIQMQNATNKYKIGDGQKKKQKIN